MIIIFLCFISCLLSIFSYIIGQNITLILIISCLTLTCLCATINFQQTFENSSLIVYEFPWIKYGELNIPFTFHFDNLSLLLATMISFITLLVILYSQEYLSMDKYIIRFTNYLCIFCLAMLLLVFSGNYLCLFIAWELVGLASYLLISFWTTRNEANKGALKAVTINRIGDIFFLFALVLMWYQSQTFSIDYIPFKTYTTTILICCCITVAACAKSAQIILHTWLPDAMEGPTPVSSLLHSATMVTAGVFLLLRSTSYYSSIVCYILAFLACFTAIIASFLGTKHFDLKRIIAYSTCSQIGLMTLAASLGNYLLSLYHLVMHAFFKCLLFLSAGSIIHSLNDEQDIRKMGGLVTYLPITFTSIFLASFSLMGFPFFSGFYSKDLLLEHSYFSGYHGVIFYLLTSLAAILTVYYSFRLIFTVFFFQTHIKKQAVAGIHEPNYLMLVPMLILLFASIFFGLFGISYFTAPFASFAVFDNFNILFDKSIEVESLNFPINNLPLNLVLISIIVFSIFFSIKILPNFFIKKLLFLFSKLSFNLKFYFDIYYTYLSTNFILFSLNMYKIIDKGFLEKTTGSNYFWDKIKLFVNINLNHFFSGLIIFLFLFLFLIIFFVYIF